MIKMLCDNCKEKEANVMYSENINGVRRELHLCEKCSRELGISKMNFNMPIDFSSFFTGMLEELQTPEFIPMFNDMKELKCKSCGYEFEDILNTGKFGCANCYDTFESRIDPIIKKIQGSNTHIGRIGKVTENRVDLENKNNTKENKNKINEIEILKENLKKAIKEENYEEAAIIRDKINKKEKQDNK